MRIDLNMECRLCLQVIRWASKTCTPLLIFMLCGTAHADNALEQWRDNAGEIRMLAENDTKRAYAEAERLQTELPADATPADRARLLNLLARIEVYRAETEKAATHIQQAMELAKQHSDPVGQAEADLNTTLNAINQARVDDAIAATIHSVSVLDGVDRPDLLGEAMLRMAMMYRRTDQLDESITMSMQAQDIALQSHNPLALAYAYQGLAIAYELSDRYSEGHDYYQRMLEQSRIAGSRMLEGHALLGIGNSKNGFGDFKSAERLIREAVEILRAVDVPFSLNFSQMSLAENLHRQGRIAETLLVYEEIIGRFQRYPNKIGLWWALNARSGKLMALGNTAAAHRDIGQAYALAKEIGAPLYLTDSAKRIAGIAAAKNNHREAYRLMLEASDMATKAAKDNAATRLLQLTRRYQTESKQREIDKLNRRNQQQAAKLERQSLERRWLWTVLGGSVVMLAGSGFFSLRLRRSKDALKKSETLYRSVVTAMSEGMVLQEANGIIISLNPAAENILNLPAQQVLGRSSKQSPWSTVYEDGTPFPSDQHPAMVTLRTGLPQFDVVMGLCRTDGEIVWISINSQPLLIEGASSPHAVVTTFHDITERKRAEHDIALMNHALDKVHEAAYLMDDGARFLYVNDESCRALGYSRDELLTLSVMDIGPGWTIERVREFWALQRETKIVESFEAVHRRKDGSQFPVEINASQFEYDGKFYGLALVRDITDRKRVEDEIRALNTDLEQRVLERTEELRLQTRYLRTLIDTLPMMAWLKDKESRFLVVNQATALACARSVDDMVGKSDLDCWPPAHAESYRAEDSEVMTTGQRKTVEAPFTDAHNDTFWVETFKAPVLDVDGSALGTVGIARDISDRKAMETARNAALAEAERLAQLRSEFMARMSHELRTPLNGIMGYAQILLGENRGNERQSVMLNIIQQSGEYLLNLINDILDFAKIEAGKQELSLSNVPLPSFLRNLASIITLKAEKKGLTFVCDIAADVPIGIRADETRLRQVLLNLLSNAVNYSERGQVRLKVMVLKSGLLRFEVQDSGIGIDTGQLETIFHAFEQAGDWHQRAGGTGLGLPISRELARMMGSDIHVSSRINEGSTFWFDLDAPAVEVCGDIIADEQHITGYQGLRRRVLVVDDVNENRALLIDILNRLGFETFEAANGQECLENVAAQMPDLILLDMVMPEMDGLETARHLRCLPGFGETPIIAVSASASGTDVTEAMKAGVNVFLSKPIDIKRLMAQLAVLLKLDWIYALPETGLLPHHNANEPLFAPPPEEMNILHRLAQEGSMRDIIRQVTYLEELDQRNRPFAAQLRTLAQAYQSKAILDLVERYIDNIVTLQPQPGTDAQE